MEHVLHVLAVWYRTPMSHYAPLVAVSVTIFTVTALLSSKFGRGIQDIPNERSLHSAPTPRIGGLGLMAGVLAGWGMLADIPAWWLLVPLVGLVAISLLDDIYSLPVSRRLLVQALAAVVVITGLGVFTHIGVLVGLISLLLVVWLTNLYNFMDGANGLAGGMALFGFGFLGVAAWSAEDEVFAMMSFVVSTSAIGFLFFNFPKAKVFMGDAGSIPLGFLAAVFGVWGWMRGLWPVWFPFLVFSPFVVDASVTLAKRGLRGAKVTEAHREHYYQRVIQMGLGHQNLALSEYVLMSAVGISGLVCLRQTYPWALMVIWLMIYGALMIFIDLRWRRFLRVLTK